MSVDVEATMRMARADALGAWSALAPQLAQADELDPLVSVALAAVLAGAAARAAELCVGVPDDPDAHRRLGAVWTHAGVAELLALSGASGLELAAIARESMRYSWSAIELALRTVRSDELDEVARAALSLLSDPRRPADERLDRALARERLGLSA